MYSEPLVTLRYRVVSVQEIDTAGSPRVGFWVTLARDEPSLEENPSEYASKGAMGFAWMGTSCPFEVGKYYAVPIHDPRELGN